MTEQQQNWPSETEERFAAHGFRMEQHIVELPRSVVVIVAFTSAEGSYGKTN